MTHHPNRRAVVAMAGAWALAGPAQATGAGLALSVSLQHEIAAALRKGQPLVAFVSLAGCPYCLQVRQSHLLPLQASGQAIVQLDMGRPLALASATGEPTTHAAMVRQWAVRVAPTLLFLGRGGDELAPRLEGVPLLDFYGAYLDQRLEAATQKLRAVPPAQGLV